MQLSEQKIILAIRTHDHGYVHLKRPGRPVRILKSITVIFLMPGLLFGLVLWKLDYIYEVALFRHLAQVTPSRIEASSTREIEETLFLLTTHQISRNLYIKGEKSPLVFLLNGFALCDQQAKTLSRLLYFRGIPSRAVPLFFDSGISNHTILEWFDGQDWVFSDPFLHLPLNIPVPAFCALDTQSAKTDSQRNLIHRAYGYYATNQGLLQELKETYTHPNHAVWDFFREKPELRLVESILSAPLELWPNGYLNLLNTAYRFRHYRTKPLMDQYILARHDELMGHCAEALEGYRALLRKVKGGGRPKDLHFELDREMLKWRMVANRRYCSEDHAMQSYPL